jgi:hypothetical protein
MARFVTVNVQCDWSICDAIAAEGDGTIVEKTVAIDGKQAKAFLLCKTHLDDFERIVLPLMAAGIKVEAPSPGKKKTAAPSAAAAPTVSSSVGNGHKSELFECRVPDCDRTLKNRTGLAQHVIRQHGFEDLAAYEAAYPDSTID